LREIDSRGKRCPAPILDCAAAVNAIASGESITLLSDDPATLPDLLAWARMTNNSVVQVSEEAFKVTKK
jgi:tRNA 2-thiouridine synthesizing protein A